MIVLPETCKHLESLNEARTDVNEFVLGVIYNRLREEKTLGKAKYNMLFIKRKEFWNLTPNFGSLGQTLKLLGPHLFISIVLPNQIHRE